MLTNEREDKKILNQIAAIQYAINFFRNVIFICHTLS
jgi:DNA-binding FrmR family transcriptional regulator